MVGRFMKKIMFKKVEQNGLMIFGEYNRGETVNLISSNKTHTIICTNRRFDGVIRMKNSK